MRSMPWAAVLIQARTGSERLPGKVLRTIGKRHTMLEHVVRRAQQSALPVFVVPPAADLEEGSAIREECDRLKIPYPKEPYPGPEEDVLGRFAHFVANDMRVASAHVLVRVTADCPFLDPAQIVMAAHVAMAGGIDSFATNVLPDRPVDGWDVEAFDHNLLHAAAAEAKEDDEREHVTPWMWSHAARSYEFTRLVSRHVWPHQMRWTVDTEADLEWARSVVEMNGNLWPPHPDVDAILDLMVDHPKLRRYTYEAT